MNTSNREVEVRFLEIDADALKQKLYELRAKDFGDDLLEEIIFHRDSEWFADERKLLKLRKSAKGVFLTYKYRHAPTVDGTEEIEIQVNDFNQTKAILQKMSFGFELRYQQKRRHSFQLDGVIIDIDTWPHVPTYVELEGSSENELKAMAKKLNFNWNNVVLENPRTVLEKYYNIQIGKLKYFTFNRMD